MKTVGVFPLDFVTPQKLAVADNGLEQLIEFLCIRTVEHRRIGMGKPMEGGGFEPLNIYTPQNYVVGSRELAESANDFRYWIESLCYDRKLQKFDYLQSDEFVVFILEL